MIESKESLTGNIISKQTITGSANKTTETILPKLQDKTVTPTKEAQTITNDINYDGLNTITINPIPDEYIIPDGTLEVTENATYDVTPYSLVSARVYPAPNLQDKSITITENGTQNITFDEGYDGLNNVEVITNIEGASGKYAPRYITFNGYTGTELDEEIANLSTSNMTNMSQMFINCSYITKLDLSSFNTSKITNMSQMFQACGKLANLDLSSFDMTNVTNITSMFRQCSVLPTINISSPVGNITSLNGLCYRCYALETFNIPNWNTTNVTDIGSMFYDCQKIQRLDLSTWVMPNVKSANLAFATCKVLKYLDVRGISFTNITSSTNMLNNVPTDCEIIVMDATQKSWFAEKFSAYTNVKTVAELGG